MRAAIANVANQAGGRLGVGLVAAHFAVGQQFVERPFKFTNVGLDVGGDIFNRFLVKLNIVLRGFGLQNGAAGFKIGQLHINGHAPFKATAQAFFKRRDTFWRLVRANNNLFICLVQRIKSMKETFLRGLFAGDKLNIVDNQHVNVTVALGKASSFVPHVVDVFIHECFAADVEN